MIIFQRHQKLNSFLKPTLLFFSAYVINISMHELAHALTAYSFGINSTLYHFYVDLNRDNGTAVQRIFIALAGPIFSLCLGILFWMAYRKSTHPSLKLFFLYSATFGISIILGNIFSTSLAGDISTTARLLNIPYFVRYAMTGIGLILLISFMYRIGHCLLNFKTEYESSKKITILATILVPWLLGTILSILIFLPLPPNFIQGIISGSLFWLAALIGAFRDKRPEISKTINLSFVNWIDVCFFIFSILIVRLLVTGIRFIP